MAKIMRVSDDGGSSSAQSSGTGGAEGGSGGGSSGDSGTIEFQFNPVNVKITKTVKYNFKETATTDSSSPQWEGSPGRTIDIGDIIFDTFEDRESVRDKYVNPLERFCFRDPDEHAPPRVMFVWGEFMQDSSASGDNTNQAGAFACVITQMDVSYTMFLNDGIPVRARVNLTLKEAITDPEQNSGNSENQSPDHAKVHTVRRGDTLQNIAYREYDNPGEWRRIAETNGIDDPTRLKPGTRLLVPPILR